MSEQIEKVIALENDLVTIDVGSKSEGRVPLSEFHRPGQKPEINIGDSIEVFIENVDNANGETILSREKAIKHAKDNSSKGDIVLIAGKGHEDYQEFKNNKRIYFDDFKIAKEIFNN